MNTPISVDKVQNLFFLPLALGIPAAVVTPCTAFTGPQHTTDIPRGAGFQISKLYNHLGPMRHSHRERGMFFL